MAGGGQAFGERPWPRRCAEPGRCAGPGRRAADGVYHSLDGFDAQHRAGGLRHLLDVSDIRGYYGVSSRLACNPRGSEGYPGPAGSSTLSTRSSSTDSALTPVAVRMKSMQCGSLPAGRYSARNVGGHLPSKASASPVSAMKSSNRELSRATLKS